jgi:3-oxoacyl-[acyl-carrier-protein] synthase II
LNEGAFVMKRVVVTGMSAVTALGNTWDAFTANVDAGKTATQAMPE